LLVVEVGVDVGGFVEESGGGLEFLGRLVAVAVEELGVVLFGAFGRFLVRAVVQEFQHVFYIFICVIFLCKAIDYMSSFELVPYPLTNSLSLNKLVGYS